MNYGFFDNQNKEYCITRPDTPRSWSNYLGSTRYGAIITNNAGGYSFFQSAAQGRFMRLRFNAIAMDQPGRYLYLRDMNTGDYWSASWQPVGKPLSEYRTECRHGTAYTRINSEYKNIESSVTYFVPLDKDFECWWVKIRNNGKETAKLRLFTFVEYACNWNAADDLINLQYTQYIASMSVHNGIIDHGTNVHIPAMPDNFQEKDQGRHTFLGLAGAEVTGYDTDRETFLGPYRTYANPVVVENGTCTGSLAVGDNPCGTLQTDLFLEPDEEKEFVVIMGIGGAQEEGAGIIKQFTSPGVVRNEFEKLRSFWHHRIEGLSINTPDDAFDQMMNMWSPFNCLITYAWSRAASLVYAGERDGLGYRDTVQDMLGVLPLIPDEARERLELMITGQVSTGGAMPVVKPFAHKPGSEKKPDEKDYRSDDCLWLFNTIPAYVKETGDIAFYDKVLPYADSGEDTVLGHLRRAIGFNLERSGKHGLPCGLKADWNDCLELGHEGETVFVAFQLRYALKTYAEIAQVLGKPSESAWAIEKMKVLDEHIERHAWDGKWYKRAFRYDGLPFGSKDCEEGKIFLNPQSWAIYSGHADDEKARLAMASVKEMLSTDYGLMICAPPYEKTDFTVIRATLMNKGMKENAGIFNHIQGWAVIAETLLGNGNQAWEYYKAYLPSAYNDRAELRQIEPYVYSQSTHSKYSPRYGASRLPWLSGTATWAYYTACTYILGFQPDYGGFRLDPCIPSAWKEISYKRRFRSREINVKVENPDGKQKGIKQILLNGKDAGSDYIGFEKLGDRNEIVVKM